MTKMIAYSNEILTSIVSVCQDIPHRYASQIEALLTKGTQVEVNAGAKAPAVPQPTDPNAPQPVPIDGKAVEALLEKFGKPQTPAKRRK